MNVLICNAIDLRDLVILIATLAAIFPTLSWLIFSVKNIMGRVSHIEISQARIEAKLDMVIKNQERNRAAS
jgi:hypothetical protein